MKWTRHRCHWVPLKTLAIEARRPSCASDTTRRTPLSPRLTSALRKRVQKASSSEGPQSTPRTRRSPSVVTPTACGVQKLDHASRGLVILVDQTTESRSPMDSEIRGGSGVLLGGFGSREI
jgi:hypothetical protein